MKYSLKSGQKIVLKGHDDNSAIHITGLDHDVAIICHNLDGLTGVCLSPYAADITKFMEEMAGTSENMLRVSLVGGKDAADSRACVKNILQALKVFDGERDLIDITAADVLSKPHPVEIHIMAGSGRILVEHS